MLGLERCAVACNLVVGRHVVQLLQQLGEHLPAARPRTAIENAGDAVGWPRTDLPDRGWVSCRRWHPCGRTGRRSRPGTRRTERSAEPFGTRPQSHARCRPPAPTQRTQGLKSATGQAPNTAGRMTYHALEKVRNGQGQKDAVKRRGDGAGEQGLAGAGRPEPRCTQCDHRGTGG